ncbi:hypothetical protein ACOMHN_040228 [Nucella lapillus]
MRSGTTVVSTFVSTTPPPRSVDKSIQSENPNERRHIAAKSWSISLNTPSMLMARAWCVQGVGCGGGRGPHGRCEIGSSCPSLCGQLVPIPVRTVRAHPCAYSSCPSLCGQLVPIPVLTARAHPCADSSCPSLCGQLVPIPVRTARAHLCADSLCTSLCLQLVPIPVRTARALMPIPVRTARALMPTPVRTARALVPIPVLTARAHPCAYSTTASSSELIINSTHRIS